MKTIRQAVSVFFMALAILLVTIVPASASQGFFLGVQLPWNDIRGDFDNTIAPSVDPGLGIGLIFGYGITPNFSLETDLSVSSHDSAGTTIDFTEWSVDAKFAFLAPQPIQPYILAGYGYYTLGDSSLRFGGYGYSLGAGVDFYTIYRWSFGIGVIEKWITYDRIEDGYIPPPLPRDGQTTTIRFDATYHFF